ncbi:hypothetical protein [Streptacidiphilus carbonis]|uniref:hypothetical protein n=1 Tax=Streptacidiphilus carbonis TaxID=105422 RepID=UPI000694BF12|nr:hypothetical protein [Streptacidiphilus carbonis]
MAGPSRKKKGGPAEFPLPADLDLNTLYGASGNGDGVESEDYDEADEELIIVPPVRLLPREELAAEALRVPLFEQAIRLAGWVGSGRPVDEFGELGREQEELAAADLALGEGDEGALAVARAWTLAMDLSLVELGEPDTDGGDTARPTAALTALTGDDPEAVLEAWQLAATTIADVVVEADLDPNELAALEEAAEGKDEEESEAMYERLEAAREQASGLLDDALQVLYEARAFADTETEQTVPLGVLAALLVVPDGEEPTEEMLGDITAVMVALDPMLQDLADIGVLDYRPIDPTLFEESEGEDQEDAPSLPAFDPDGEVDDAEAARFGLARLTALGVHQVRQWLLEEGYEAPLIGDLARGTAAELLEGICAAVNVLPEEEITEWLTDRDPAPAAAELLTAARGNDLTGPMRRLLCASALSRLDDTAEPSLRGVLDDPELAGLATTWLAERGVGDFELPGRPVMLWTMVDTLAAQLIEAGPGESGFTEFVAKLSAEERPAELFAELWRIEHPYTMAVLEAVGERHPDKATAKEARKAAYKARSRMGSERQQ